MSRPMLGDGAPMDIQRLIESRLLIQANSGGGKSWAIRRLLEQTWGACQHIVIDVEGEFHTLREKFDYVLAGQRGGDCAATPKTAALLARRLLELGVSAIVDIYELGVQRQQFVARFLESLVSAPRELWHPALIVVDEAHMFCPEAGKSESAAAVIDLMTRGRKRGFCGVLATQRIAKLSKDAAAEVNNKLIGRTALDIDMARAGAELGFTSKDEMRRLRTLPAGTFYAFGPALSPEVTQIVIGPVATTHPKAGQRAMPPTPPKGRIREVLAQLADLPAEADAEVDATAKLRSRVAELERQLSGKTVAHLEIRTVERPVLTPADAAKLESLIDRIDHQRAEMGQARDDAARLVDELVTAGRALRETADRARAGAELSSSERRRIARQHFDSDGKHAVRVGKHEIRAYQHNKDESSDPGDDRLAGPERRLLEALTWMESIGQTTPPIEAVAFLANYRPGGGAFNNTRGALRSKGLVNYPTPGTIALTAEGRAWAPRPPAPGSGEQLRATVLARLAGPERKLLEPLLEVYPRQLTVEQLAVSAGYEAGGGAFNNTRGRLRTLGLVDYPQRGSVRAADLLFPEGT